VIKSIIVAKSIGKKVHCVVLTTIFTKVAHCKSTKEIWDRLRNIYEGDSKFKATKIRTYRGQFEQLKMKEDEDITSYFLQVDETVNAIIGLGEEIEEYVIVQKVLRSLPMRFNHNISTLEENIGSKLNKHGQTAWNFHSI
jgi:hypothetical protein